MSGNLPAALLCLLATQVWASGMVPMRSCVPETCRFVKVGLVPAPLGVTPGGFVVGMQPGGGYR